MLGLCLVEVWPHLHARVCYLRRIMVLSNCAIDAVSLYPTYRKSFDLIFQMGARRTFTSS